MAQGSARFPERVLRRRELVKVVNAICAVALIGAVSTPALAQSSAQSILNRLRTGNTQPASPNATGAKTASSGPISAPAMPVALKKSMGQQKAFAIFPSRVIVAGYNVGGFRTAKTTGRASGGILNNNPGASSTVELVAWGIDLPLLTRIASAAHADLIAQLTAAGFDVVPQEQVMASAGADKLKLGGDAYDVEVPADRGNMKGIVTGPAATGVRGNYPLARTEFGSFGAPLLSLTQQAMVIMPNLMFDFAGLKSSKSIGYTASASASLQFGINPALSTMRVMASRRKEFLEGDFIFKLDGNAVSDEPIGTIADSSRSDNSYQQALGNALGVGVRAQSRESSAVSIDQAKYEALALSAARGWNAAFVSQLKAATSKP